MFKHFLRKNIEKTVEKGGRVEDCGSKPLDFQVVLAVSCPRANPNLLPVLGGPIDFSQVSVPLMTPPVSPAALVHRGSVINQGPMAGRPLTSCSFSSLSVMTQPSPCPSYPETLYHCLPQTSTSYYPPVSSSSAPACQAALRSFYSQLGVCDIYVSIPA